MPETTIPTCYRHHDRETRLRCSSCDRPVCVDCVRSAAVGQKCVECAAPDRDQRIITSSQLYGGTLRERAPVTFALIALSAAIFVLGYVPGVREAVFSAGAQDNELVAGGEVWRVVTATFLHRDLFHIGFNMYALYLFGPQLERAIGRWTFLALYLAAAIAGGTAFYVWGVVFLGTRGSALGASGAIFGLFGATLVAALRQRGTPAGDAGVRQLFILLAINLALPLVLPVIAWQAHIGGLVAGAVIAGAFFLVRDRGAAGARLRTLIAVMVGLVCLAVLLLV